MPESFSALFQWAHTKKCYPKFVTPPPHGPMRVCSIKYVYCIMSVEICHMVNLVYCPTIYSSLYPHLLHK